MVSGRGRRLVVVAVAVVAGWLPGAPVGAQASAGDVTMQAVMVASTSPPSPTPDHQRYEGSGTTADAQRWRTGMNLAIFEESGPTMVFYSEAFWTTSTFRVVDQRGNRITGRVTDLSGYALVPASPVWMELTVTGGTGPYAGATGSGTFSGRFVDGSWVLGKPALQGSLSLSLA